MSIVHSSILKGHEIVLILTSISPFHFLQFHFPTIPAILYYDHLLTFRKEVELIWSQSTHSTRSTGRLGAGPLARARTRRFTFIRVLFVANRYLTCFGYIPVVYFTFDVPKTLIVSVLFRIDFFVCFFFCVSDSAFSYSSYSYSSFRCKHKQTRILSFEAERIRTS